MSKNLTNNAPATFIQKFNLVQGIGIKTKMPWEISRITGVEYLDIMGDQVCINTNTDTDYVSMEEAKKALELLISEFGGVIKWQK